MGRLASISMTPTFGCLWCHGFPSANHGSHPPLVLSLVRRASPCDMMFIIPVFIRSAFKKRCPMVYFRREVVLAAFISAMGWILTNGSSAQFKAHFYAMPFPHGHGQSFLEGETRGGFFQSPLLTP